MSSYSSPISLCIPIGQSFHEVLQPFYSGYLPPYYSDIIEYRFTLVGYGTSDDGYSVPSLPEGLTFDERSSALYGTVNSNDVTSSNCGLFILYINELMSPPPLYLSVGYIYYDISYYTP